MLNDAAALVAYKVAVTATVAGTFAIGSAAADFLVSAAGGVALGLAIGWIGARVQRRLTDAPLAIFLSGPVRLRRLHRGRGGRCLGRPRRGEDRRLFRLALARDVRCRHAAERARVLAGARLRAQRDAVRAAGAAVRGVFESLRETGYAGALLNDVVVVSLVVIAVRLAWQAVPPLLARVSPALGRADTGEDWRERLVVGWSGLRGAISLAAALALPEALDSGAEFAQRDLLILITVGVIAVTLVGQG